MLGVKRTLGLSGLVGLLAALAFAVPAHAAGSKLVCTINGQAKTLDKDGSGRGVLLMGGHGNYTFRQAPLACAGQEKGVPAVVQFSIRSMGYYDNQVCGTGKAVSQWGAGNNTITPGSFQKTGGDPAKDEAYYQNKLNDAKYAVDFHGFVGEFFWHNDPLGPKPESTTKPATIPKTGVDTKNEWSSTDKDYVYAGEIVLTAPSPLPPDGKTPPVPPPNNGECTKAFTAAGSIVIDF